MIYNKCLLIFQLCEVDLSEMLPPEALAPFMDEIKNRANQRKQLAKKVNMLANILHTHTKSYLD
jgi:hypothetical protein